MKRKLFTLIITIITLCFATEVNAQFRWGATAGVNINDMKFKQDLFTVDQAVGGSAGVRAEMMFPGIGFGLDLGLMYEQRGATLHMGEKLMWESQGYGKERLYIHYIDIPFHLKFKYTRLQGLEDYVAPFVYGGPTFGIQAGHSKCDAIDFSGGEIALTAGAGVELYKRWQVSASYTWGMTYALKTVQLKDFSAQNRTWDIRVTYFF
ncbi:MAG: PorT family protein [Duncaniella sp.]|nr:PorT family protein [Muribaculum sp.]MCM1255660.1 PorT family protein [Duncaniella sp.]